MAKILLVCDSRGRGLEEKMRERRDGREWTVKVHKGKGMMKLVDAAIKHSYRQGYNTVIIMGGICDVTNLILSERIVRVRRAPKAELVDRVFEEIHPALELLRSITNRVLLAATYGVEMRRFNIRMFGSYDMEGTQEGRDEQYKVDMTVDLFNKRVADINAASSQPTIRLGNRVHHRRKNGAVYTTYQLLSDGCHPGTELLEAHAKSIGNTIERIGSRR